MIDEKLLIETMQWRMREAGTSDWNRCIDEVEMFIKEFPKVCEWIPVSDRLPEKSNSYEVTIEYDNKQRTVIAYYSTKEHRWSTYTAFVTAWRERLPEPYKAGEQECH